MPRTRLRVGLLALAALYLAFLLAAAAHGEPEQCRFAIARASSSFLQSETRAVQGCKERILRGKLATGTDCDLDGKTGASIGGSL